MKTRAAARNKIIQSQKEDAKAADLKQLILAAELWLKEGVVINPKFKQPSDQLMGQWKLFVASAQSHPNILAHQDFQCIRDLLQSFGAYITYETCKLMVELDAEHGSTSVHHLRPYVEPVGNSLACTMFGKVEKFQLIPDLNAVIILEYTIMEEFLTALYELVDFIWTYPEALLYDSFVFIYEFLLRFGVSSYTITYEIYQTQCRRAQNKTPASSLLLKLGVPGSAPQLTEEEDEVLPVGFSEDSKSPYHWNSLSQRRGSDSSHLSDDSGVETSCESLDYPTSDFQDELRSNGIVFGRKSVVVEEDVTEDPIFESDDDDEGAEDKPYKCTTCFRRYISKGNCNWHIRKRHPGAQLLPGSKLVRPSLSFYCPICSKAFTSPQYVKNHVERLHPKESRKQPTIRHSSFKFVPTKKAKLKKPEQQRQKQFSSFSRHIPKKSEKSDTKFLLDESFQRKILSNQPKIKLIAVDKF